MKTLIVGLNDAGQRLDRLLGKTYPLLSTGMMNKGIRNKRIKVDGARAKPFQVVGEGSVIELYINDEYLLSPDKEEAWRHIHKSALAVVYEDDNILLLDKPSGMPVQPDSHESINTLISHLKAYLFHAGRWDPEQENSFTPALCNRIDRNTRGIVIAAKNAESLRIMNKKIKDREIEKYYLCIVHGLYISCGRAHLRVSCLRMPVKNRVYVKKQSD